MLGIDFGGSYADCVVSKKGRILFSYSTPAKDFEEKKLFSEIESRGLLFGGIRVTGMRKRLQKKFKRVGEIESIALGARVLSREKDFVAASVGTGTAIAAFKNQKAFHAGGTAVGGGTLEGLSRLLLGCNAVQAHALALKGRSVLDISVGDIAGGRVGMVPGNATASNFGAAAKNARKQDVAKSLFNMVGETAGVCASLAAQKTGVRKAVFVGRASAFPLIRTSAERACKLYSVKAVFPENGELATALGASLQ
ncbi:MAG: hypothetical protein QXR53_02140 [Candidatus Norongarragalinales archaeon]